MVTPTEPPVPRASDGSGATTLADVLDVARELPGGVVGADGEHVCWAEIADRADRLAATLWRAGCGPDDRVAVLLPKSIESFIAMHGVLRAALIAVPLNPLATRRALAPILATIAPRIIVTTPELADRLLTAEQPEGRSATLILVGDSASKGGHRDGQIIRWNEALAADPSRAERPSPGPDDDAYIIFTSGSTGEPKGMVHTHRSALAYAQPAVVAHEFDHATRLAGTAPLHFDMSTLELYSVPLAGAVALTITEADERFPVTLGARLVEQRATHLYAVPSLLHQLVHRGNLEQLDLASLRHVAFAGEPMGATLLSRLMDRLPHAAFLNAYGPAELNVVTSHRFEPDWDRGSVPIGSVWPDVLLKVVDEVGDEVAAGVAGELIVSTHSCMRGYWRLDGETAARIAVDEHGMRWYRTGDLVRVAEGVLHFVGRQDNQVKVRGVRIEIEAVEHALGAEPSVAQALVASVADADGMNSLHAWVVVRPEGAFDERRVLRWCRARLAAAAVPASCTAVEALPVTPNGKIDRAAVAGWVGGTRSS